MPSRRRRNSTGKGLCLCPSNSAVAGRKPEERACSRPTGGLVMVYIRQPRPALPCGLLISKPQGMDCVPNSILLSLWEKLKLKVLMGQFWGVPREAVQHRPKSHFLWKGLTPRPHAPVDNLPAREAGITHAALPRGKPNAKMQARLVFKRSQGTDALGVCNLELQARSPHSGDWAGDGVAAPTF